MGEVLGKPASKLTRVPADKIEDVTAALRAANLITPDPAASASGEEPTDAPAPAPSDQPPAPIEEPDVPEEEQGPDPAIAALLAWESTWNFEYDDFKVITRRPSHKDPRVKLVTYRPPDGGAYRIMSESEIMRRMTKGNRLGYHLLSVEREKEAVALLLALRSAPDLRTPCTYCGSPRYRNRKELHREAVYQLEHRYLQPEISQTNLDQLPWSLEHTECAQFQKKLAELPLRIATLQSNARLAQGDAKAAAEAARDEIANELIDWFGRLQWVSRETFECWVAKLNARPLNITITLED